MPTVPFHIPGRSLRAFRMEIIFSGFRQAIRPISGYSEKVPSFLRKQIHPSLPQDQHIQARYSMLMVTGTGILFKETLQILLDLLSLRHKIISILVMVLEILVTEPWVSCPIYGGLLHLY